MRFVLSLALTLFSLATPLFAQWEYKPLPFDGVMDGFEVLPSGLVLSQTAGGTYASQDSGKSWYFTGIRAPEDFATSSQSRFDAAELSSGDIAVTNGTGYLASFEGMDIEVAGWSAGIVPRKIAINQDTVVVSSLDHIHLSTNGGSSFTEVLNQTNQWDHVQWLDVLPNGTFAAWGGGIGGFKLWFSNNGGTVWKSRTLNAITGDINDIEIDPSGSLYVGTDEPQIWKIDNIAESVPVGYYDIREFTTFDINDNEWIVGCNGTSVYIIAGESKSDYEFDGFVYDVAWVGNTILAATEYGYFNSSDNGETWIEAEGIRNNPYPLATLTPEDTLYASQGYRLFKGNGFDMSDITLPSLPSNATITSLQSAPSGRVFISGSYYDSGHQYFIYYSDGTHDWTVPTGIAPPNYYGKLSGIFEYNGALYMVQTSTGLLSSVNGGADWTLVNDSDDCKSIDFSVTDDGTFFSHSGNQLKVSTNQGATWETKAEFAVDRGDASPTTNAYVAEGGFEELKVTTDGGDSWSDIEDAAFAALPAHIWVSEDPKAFGYDGNGILFIAYEGANTITGDRETIVVASGNDGQTFEDVSTDALAGLINMAAVKSIERAPSGELLLFTGMGLFHSGVTALNAPEEYVSGIPSGFALEQNYPNPFNPETTLRFAIPRAGKVNLTVFDLTGRAVASLANGPVAAGAHEVVFDGSGLASGVYYYRLQTEGFGQTRRMLLLK